MKTRVLYFALAVAAAAIASSCVKEQAEPMDPEAEITGQVFEAKAFPPFIQKIVESGGLLPYLKEKQGK
jgi:hypothetical protein